MSSIPKDAKTTLPLALTVEEVAKLLRISRGAAYQAVRRGELPGVVRVGRTLRVSRDAVLEWLGQGCVSRKGTHP